MKKRLIDIYPPHSRNTSPFQEEPSVSDNGGSKRAALAVFLILLFATPPVFLHFFFAKAQIEVWPHITKLRMEEHIVAQVGYDNVNLEKKIIRARVFEEEKELTQLFPSSGKKFKEEKAHGIIRVYNENSGKPQTLVGNTRFISEDGKLYRLHTTAVIPVGFLDVQVLAAEAGPEFNIGPSNFSLPGLVGSALYTKIYGKSLEAMSGGSKKEVAVVTQEDIAAAKDQLVETLKIQATKSLLLKIPSQFHVLEHSLDSTVLEDNSLVKPGAELDQFNYTSKVKVAISGFHKEDADLLSRQTLEKYLEPNQAINEQTLRLSYKTAEGETGSSNGKGLIPITSHIEVDQYERVEKARLLERMAGATVEEFRQIMKEYPFVAKAQFSLWPFWSKRIPQDSKRVHIDVHLTSW